MEHPEFSYAKKGLVVRLVYLLVALCSAFSRTLFGSAAGVVVLCFHSVSTRQRPAFERQMQYIQNRAANLNQIEGISDNDSLVLVTFDDAFECLLKNVVPVVRDLKIPIGIFAVTENLAKAPAWLAGSGHPDASLPTMSPEQLWQLAKEPEIIIGSHSVSHRRLGDLPVDEVDIELTASKASLEKMLGTRCDYLALPHGSYRPEVIELAQRCGYSKVLTLDEIARPSRWPAGTVGRFSVSPDMWMIEFVLTVHGAYAWLYAWRNLIRRARSSLVGVGRVQ